MELRQVRDAAQEVVEVMDIPEGNEDEQLSLAGKLRKVPEAIERYVSTTTHQYMGHVLGLVKSYWSTTCLDALGKGDEDILHYYALAKTQQKWAKSCPVVVRRRPCEPHNPTLLSLGGGSHLKRESHPFPIGLVFWGDWAFC